jgi:hypothetical protein
VQGRGHVVRHELGRLVLWQFDAAKSRLVSRRPAEVPQHFESALSHDACSQMQASTNTAPAAAALKATIKLLSGSSGLV